MDELGPYFGGEGPRAKGVGGGKPAPIRGLARQIAGVTRNMVLATRKTESRLNPKKQYMTLGPEFY